MRASCKYNRYIHMLDPNPAQHYIIELSTYMYVPMMEFLLHAYVYT